MFMTSAEVFKNLILSHKCDFVSSRDYRRKMGSSNISGFTTYEKLGLGDSK